MEVGKIVTDEKGYGRLEGLPAGNYDIAETKAPQGYLQDQSRRTVTVNGSGTVVYNCEDTPGSDSVMVLLVKQDAETGAAQANGKLEGAEYTVRYYDGNYSSDPALEGKEPKYEWIFRTDENGIILFDEEHKVSGDAFVLGTDAVPVLPVGTLTIQETKEPQGYLLNDTVYVANTIIENGTSVVTVNLPDSEICAAEEQIIRGDLEFIKINADDQSTMAGIPFTLTSKTTGESHLLITDANGYCSTESSFALHTKNTNRGTSAADGIWFGEGAADDGLGALPYDIYVLEEQPCEANKGKDLASVEINISSDKSTVNLGRISNYTAKIYTAAADTASGAKTIAPSENASVTDTVTYKNLTVGRTYKLSGRLVEKKTGEALIIGGNPVTAEVEFVPEAKNGTVDMVFCFDASGLAGQELVVYEYLTWNGIPVVSHEDINDTDQTVYIARIETTALDANTQSHVGSVREKAVIVDTVAYRGLTPGKNYQVSGILMDRTTGEPLLVNGSEVTASRTFAPDVSEGTIDVYFRFDAAALAGRTVVAFETVSYEGAVLASHADINDEEQSVYYPRIDTSASDAETESHLGTVAEKTVITDTVYYENLIPDQEYTIQGKLVMRGNGEELMKDESAVSAELTFTPDGSSGTVVLTYEINGSDLAGQTIAVAEELFYSGINVVSHADPEDEEQSIHFPAVGTTALDGDTGSHTGTLQEQAVIEDIISYVNLIPGQEYTVRGKLMVKETGEELMQGGRPVVINEKFIPENASGTVKVAYEFDSRGYAGQTIVVFEELLHNGITVARHENLQDENQSVFYPAIRTQASDKRTGDHLAAISTETILCDTVSYQNLIPGETYVLNGILMDRNTGEQLLAQSRAVTAKYKFTPEKSEGTVTLSYELNSEDLKGTTAVIYESLYYNGVLIASHQELTDNGQTVLFPDMKTEALDQNTNGHTGVVSEKAVITDQVKYSNLIPGREYTIQGRLMVKETGEELAADGEAVRAEMTFTAEASSGTAVLTYQLDSRGLAGQTVVVFEKLLCGEVVIVSHGDLADEAQSIRYPRITTEATAYGSHEVMASGTIDIQDKVTYENLVPGKTYTLKGRLMDQTAGTALLVNEAEVTAMLSFVPDSPSGSLKMNFELPADGLAESKLVVFEELYHNNVLVGTHSDLNDAAQTVALSALPPKTEIQGPKSGDPSNMPAIAAVVLGTGLLAAFFGILKHRAMQKKL